LAKGFTRIIDINFLNHVNFIFDFTIYIEHEIQQELCKGNGSHFKTHALFNFNNVWKNLKLEFDVNSIFELSIPICF
jgi:hypothetical protein